jgi:hypothetical protein
MRPVLLSAVSVAGKFVDSLCSLDLRCVACGFNEMPALCAPVFGEVPLVLSDDPATRYAVIVGGVVGYESVIVIERRGRENTSPPFYF